MNNNKNINRRGILKLSATVAAGAGIGGFVKELELLEKNQPPVKAIKIL